MNIATVFETIKPWIPHIICGIIVIVGVFKCFNVLKPSEMGIKVFLGKPAEAGIDSGPCWIWWPLQSLVRYSKEPMNFKFYVNSIMTERGKVDGHDGVVMPVVVDLECRAYAYFNRERLAETIQFAPGNTAQAIGPVILPYAVDAYRTIVGAVPWRLTNNDRKSISAWVRARLVSGVPFHDLHPQDENVDDELGGKKKQKVKFYHFKDGEPESSNVPDSPWEKMGLTGVTVAIEDLNFRNPELQTAISAAEKASNEAEALKKAAVAERVQLEQRGEGAAFARQKMVDVIKGNPDLEVLRVLENMAQGTSNTMWLQIPEGVAGKIQSLLGGKSVANALTDIGKRWESMDDSEKASIRQALAGLARVIKGKGTGTGAGT